MRWDPARADLLLDSDEARPLSHEEARNLVGQILEAASRKETEPVGRSTTIYRATVRWTGPDAQGQPCSGEEHFMCNEMHRRSTVEAMCEGRPDLALRIPPDLYGRASGLYELVEAQLTRGTTGTAASQTTASRR